MAMTLGDALRRQNNNADLLRLIAACAVIWGHSYALVPQPGMEEPIGRLLGFDYSGSLAVKFFFFLSGVLVTKSWLSSQSPLRFISARVFRIFPALIVSAAVCMLVLGAALTTTPVPEYFSNSWMYWHIIIKPQTGYELPGVFTQNAYHAVNGSLWTIPYELTMYGLLLGAALCGPFKKKWIATFFLVGIVFFFFRYPEKITFLGLLNVNDAGYLVAFFAFGSLLAVHKDDVSIDRKLVVGLFLLTWMLRSGPAFQYVFYATFALTPLWIMTLAPIKAIKLPGDYSYGVYVYGWPVQQTVASQLPHIGVHLNQLYSIAISIVVAAASWHLVEKPCIAFGHALPTIITRIRMTARRRA